MVNFEDNRPGNEYDEEAPYWREAYGRDPGEEIDEGSEDPHHKNKLNPADYNQQNQNFDPSGFQKSGEDNDAIDKSFGLSGDQLATGEAQAPTEASLSEAQQTEVDKLLNYTGGSEAGAKSKQSLPVRFMRGFTRRRMIGGGVIGLAAAVIFGGITLTSGPLQFIHIAQSLTHFHFASQEDASDDRMLKIARYIHYRGDERTRLNTLGNKYANETEARLNRSGIETAYTDTLRYYDGYVVDPAKIPENSELHGKSPPEIQSYYKEKFNTDFEILADGKLRVSAEDMGYFKQKSLVRNMLQESGYSKVTAALRARIMGKRGGITWHPMKKLDRRLLENTNARLKAWQEDRERRINQGEDARTVNRTPEDADGDGRADDATQGQRDVEADTTDVAGQADELGEQLGSGEAPQGESKLGSSVGKIAAGTMVIGVLCLAQSMAQHVDAIKVAHVVLPLMRLGMEAVTVGNQVMSGNGADLEQLGFYVRNLYSKENGSWVNAKSIQAENHEAQTGVDIRDEAQIPNEKNILNAFLGSFPGLAQICSAAASPLGQAFGFVIDVLSGPVGAVVGLATSTLLAPRFIEGLTNMLAGHPINTFVTGADYGNYINYGARLAANDSSIAGGGRALSDKEVVQLKNYEDDSYQADFQSHSFAYRLFNPYDSRSMIAKVIDRQSPELGTNMANLAYGFLKVGSSLANLPSQFLSKKVMAQAPSDQPYDYGFAKYGFSVDELNNDAVKIPVENAQHAANTLEIPCVINGQPNHPCGEDYIKDIKVCFGVVVARDIQGKWNVSADGGSVPSYESIKAHDDAHSYSGTGCESRSLLWLQLRFFIFDTQIMNSNACYQGNGQSCTYVGFGSDQAQDTGQ